MRLSFALCAAALFSLPALALEDSYRATGPVTRPLQTTAEPASGPGPRFADRAQTLPGQPHVYGGGWEHFVGGGVAVFDCDGDARPDLLAAGGEHPSTAYRNITQTGGALRFEALDIPPLDGMTGITGAYPLDIDSDGAMDLFVLRAGANLALRGDGMCGFTDATAAWGIDPGDAWSTAFSATWEPGHAFPTLAIGNYVDRDDPDGPFEACDDNTLLRPDGAGYGPAIALSPGYCALSALFSDWSRSGRADLRLSNDRHYYVRAGSEQMWKMAPLRLLGPDDGWRPISIWGMGIASRDLNGDGRPDVMLTSMGDQLLQYATETAGYIDAPWGTGSHATRPHLGDDGRPSTGWHAQFGDVDNDGLADLFIAKGNVDQMPDNAMRDPNNLLMGRIDGTFVETSITAGVATTDRARGAALSDLDGDGRLDIVVVNRRAPLELWQNETVDVGHWIAITPRQTGTNTHAVGAWVEARLPDGTVTAQEMTVGGGHAGGQAGPLHFGLGPADQVEIRITWPDGSISDWAQVNTDRAVTLWRDGSSLIAR
ncbi:CRTAC1 family protein [Meridianimarinicoccus aquatilis]|uniref:CRTAC1 family protein n=1 Tax=Meridianimarinicoccus aquatilis TaxID=2552766 RepID=A0A4R6B4X8_9RHOB|nr:CRTAC1 family protein [Fluviibacterium aquatile]TDL90466.1 CRTAC1 family protein [Fluviibacterium aquatile]